MKARVREALDAASVGYAERKERFEAKRRAHNAIVLATARRTRGSNVIEIPVRSPLYQKQLRRQEAA